MTTIKRNKIVPYSVEAMYNLINDIPNYSAFLPWCTRATVLSQDENEVRAELTLSKGGLEKSFTTCNRLQKNKMIEVRLVEGPFKHLEGFWLFERLDDGHTRISLELSFEFTNMLIGLAFGPIFNQIANSLVDAFCQRADVLYAPSLH